MDLVPLTFVLLRRGPRALEYDTAELERLQAGHLAFLESMHAAGHLLVAGPFGDQEDETLRGICVYRTSVEETRRLVGGDPAVQAGRMRAEVMTLWTRRGALEFPQAGR